MNWILAILALIVAVGYSESQSRSKAHAEEAKAHAQYLEYLKAYNAAQERRRAPALTCQTLSWGNGDSTTLCN